MLLSRWILSFLLPLKLLVHHLLALVVHLIRIQVVRWLFLILLMSNLIHNWLLAFFFLNKHLFLVTLLFSFILAWVLSVRLHVHLFLLRIKLLNQYLVLVVMLLLLVYVH